jgi:hypothetical protein
MDAHQLLDTHFKKVGRYTLGMSPDPAPDFEIIDAESADDHSVYVLTHRDRVLYVGKSVSGARKERLSWYGRLTPGRKEHADTDTRNRLYLTCLLIQEHLDHGSPEPVDAWLFRPEPIDLLGLQVHVHSGLEDALHRFAEWNQPGRPKTSDQIASAKRKRGELAARLLGMGH